MKKIGLIVLTAALVLCLTACGGISESVDLKYGETYKIENEKLASEENLTWESDDETIASVADDGTVTAKAPGKAKVDIKADGKEVGEYTFNVSIVPIEQIVFSSDAIELTEGDSAVVKYTLLPQDASDYGITWTSADESIVKVRAANNVQVISKSQGKTTIIATTETGVVAQCSVEVTSKSAYEQLNKAEKQFVDDILPIMSNFKNPASVRFNAIEHAYLDSYYFEVAAQNGFGGNTVTVYWYDKAADIFMEWPLDVKSNLNAELVTQAIHENLGY